MLEAVLECKRDDTVVSLPLRPPQASPHPHPPCDVRGLRLGPLCPALPDPRSLPGDLTQWCVSSVTSVPATPTLPPAQTVPRAADSQTRPRTDITPHRHPHPEIQGPPKGASPCQLSPHFPLPTPVLQQICRPTGPDTSIFRWSICSPLGPAHPSPLSEWQENDPIR